MSLTYPQGSAALSLVAAFLEGQMIAYQANDLCQEVQRSLTIKDSFDDCFRMKRSDIYPLSSNVDSIYKT